MKWLLSLLLGILLIGYLGLVLFANRATYTAKFDPDYWRDKYENSQWLLPQSKRGIGDDGLYLYQGYRLMSGDDPTLFNAEVPPLGKYAIGLSLRYLGNGNVYGLLVTTASLIVFFFLARILLVSTPLALATTLLVAVDPLITSQFPLTMLESMQLLFLLLTILLATRTLRQSVPNQQMIFTLLTGFSLGLFSVAKFPLFTPLVGAPILWLLWKKVKQNTQRFVLLFALFSGAWFVGFLVPYIQYFFLGHTLIDWIGVQKWILNFYRSAHLKPRYGSMIATMLVGKLQNLFTYGWQQVPEWTPSWTVLLLVFPLWCLRMWKKHTVLVGALIATVILFNLIPFWTRYLVPLLPLLYLVTVFFFIKTIKRFALIAVLILLAANAWVSQTILFPTPEKVVAQVLYDWQNGLFQDLYEHTTNEIKAKTSRSRFHEFGQTVFHGGGIEKVTLTQNSPAWSSWKSSQTITLTITYTTRFLGEFTQKTTVPVVREAGAWRIPWRWEFLIDGINESRGLHTTVSLAKRGTITDKTKATPVARDMESWLVWVTPYQIDKNREEEMLQFLQGLFDKRVAAALIHLRYSQKPSHFPVALGVARAPLEDATRQELLSYPGITLTPAFYRWMEGQVANNVGYTGNSLFSECCSYLYNTTAYDGVSGWEAQYNEVLKGRNGGSLVIKDTTGNIVRTILSVEKQDGKDVEL